MTTPFDLESCLAKLGRWLPYQGPLHEFVCLNPLMAFQHLNFHDGMRRASQIYGAYNLMELGAYRRAWRERQISETALERTLAWHVQDPEARERARQDLFEYPEGSTPKPIPFAMRGMRSRWRNDHDVSLKSHAEPLLMRLIGAYLDQGVAVWRMPEVERGFFGCVANLVTSSWIAFDPLSDPICRSLLAMGPDKAAHHALERLVEDPQTFERYLLEVLFSLSGWSAMVRQIELKPTAVLAKRPITLKDFVAVALVLEVGVLSRELGPDFAPLPARLEDLAALPMDTPVALSRLDWIKTVWHEALEWSLYEQALKILARPRSEIAPQAKRPVIQAAFCIDDRECSVRRHLETVDPEVETIGTAGFFGMDFMYQYYDAVQPSQNCPIVLNPRHVVRAEPTILSQKKTLTLLTSMDQHSHTLVRGWFIAHILGIYAAFKMTWSIFWPRLDHKASSAVNRLADRAVLKLERKGEECDSHGFLMGYSLPEMVERIASQLITTGIRDRLAPLVVLVAHGSSTVNNPHFAAYDCGACMGKPGSPNARAFAIIANKPEVRAGLRERGLHIPADTIFIGALHDTTRDELVVFDAEELPVTHQSLLLRFQQDMDKALARNAQERCRRFESIPLDVLPAEALNAVRLRSVSLFETQPELTHVTNALAIVGRRQLTRGYFMDRRVFLNCYDPYTDPDGMILTSVLGAVVPVGGGINLTYFFARMDNQAYGAGTKLPHNVVGLVGVSNGVEGDLLTGLPLQMVDVHEPLRLMVIVDQKADVALQALQRNAGVYEWIKNDWVRYAAVDPDDGSVHVYRNGQMVGMSFAEVAALSCVDGYADGYRGYRDHRRFVQLSRDALRTTNA